MPAITAAAIYARISSDQDGTALGVGRQLEDCRRLAADLGWPVADEYVDNDISAYTGKRRPEYQRLLADISDGHRDAVIAYHADRLTRRPIELEHFLEVLEAAHVRHVRFAAGGEIDIANGDGLMVLRMLAAVAANESASKSRRIRRKLDQNAAAGRPHGGYLRPFGYAEDKITVRETEAEIIRSLAVRYVAGESIRSLASWLNEMDIRTVAGGPWRSGTLRQLLLSGRIAGLRQHRGEIVGPAAWQSIITQQQRDGILARQEQSKISRERSPRRYALSGLLRCGLCGNKLFSSPRDNRCRRYVCVKGPDHHGCGHLTIVAEPVEALIAEAVLYRLDTPELAAALEGRASDDSRTILIGQKLSEDRIQLDDLALLYSSREITSREWAVARQPIEARIREAEAVLARATKSDALTGLAGQGTALRAAWEGLNLTRQHAIVAAVLDYAVIAPGTRGLHSLDPARVDPRWRL